MEDDRFGSGDTVRYPAYMHRLRLWGEFHALGMLTLISLSLMLGWSARLTGAGAVLSLCGAIILGVRQWTPSGALGAANVITLLRFAATLPFFFDPEWNAVTMVALAFAILWADGLDGWVARRLGQTSPFGEALDREVDALFLLGLCFLLYGRSQFGPWVLLPGSLRYLFVIFIRLAGPPQGRVKSTRLTRSIGVVVMLSFMLCLLPMGSVNFPLAVLASLALVGSFLSSLWHLYQPASND